MVHGGDIYNNRIELDCSVNVSPLGIPDKVKPGLVRSLENMSHYPEYDYAVTRKAIAAWEGCEAENVVCTNGASEAFMAIVHAFRPKKGLLIGPGFYGYEYCLNAVECEIKYHMLSEEDGFELGVDLINCLDDSLDIVFLGNPNNPTGKYVKPELLMEICETCRRNNIFLVIDECFYLFGDYERHGTQIIKQYGNVCIVNGFTKICSLAGLRTGYILTNEKYATRIAKHLPEWNVSLPAASAMVDCVESLKDGVYLQELWQLANDERIYLTEELKKLGIRVFESQTNFILFRCEADLYTKLLQQQMLIRDCSNYPGLGKGYYRIAVMKHETNMRLVDAIKKIMEQEHE